MRTRATLYPTDLFSLGGALFFSACSFFNLGKVRISVAGRAVDRELLAGILLLLLAAVLLVLFRLANPSRSRLVHFVRLFYPQLLYLVFFQEAILLSQLFFDGRSLDPIFARADALIFGLQPAVVLHQVLPRNRLLVELFFFGYFSYFPLIISGWWVLYWQGRYAEASRAFTLTSAGFFLLFAFYVFFPVHGPKYYFEELRTVWYADFRGYLFTSILQGIFDRMNLAGAAFPSSHVAIATVALLLNRRYNPLLAAAFLPITLLLFTSTVYLYAHYAVDVLAGLACGLLFWFLMPRLLRLDRPAAGRVEERLSRFLRLPPIALPSTPFRRT